MATEKFTSYGVRELQVFPLTNGTYGAGVEAEGVSAFNSTPVSQTVDLIGNDKIVSSKTILEGYDLTFENGIWEFDTLKVLDSSVISADGKVLTTSESDKKQEYGILARIFVEEGDDLVLAYPRVKTGQITEGYASQQFAKVSVTAKALADDNGVFRKMIRHKGELTADLFTATTGATV